MANYTGTPTIAVPTYESGDRNGKFVYVVKGLSIVLSAQGGGTNLIPATALGFKAGYLYGAICNLFTDGSTNKRTITLFTDGTNLYTADPQVVTDANRGLAADVTGTLVFTAYGLPA